MNRILQLFARYELCTDPKFYETLNKSSQKIERKKQKRTKKQNTLKKPSKPAAGTNQKSGKSSMMITALNSEKSVQTSSSDNDSSDAD